MGPIRVEAVVGANAASAADGCRYLCLAVITFPRRAGASVFRRPAASTDEAWLWPEPLGELRRIAGASPGARGLAVPPACMVRRPRGLSRCSAARTMVPPRRRDAQGRAARSPRASSCWSPPGLVATRARLRSRPLIVPVGGDSERLSPRCRLGGPPGSTPVACRDEAQTARPARIAVRVVTVPLYVRSMLGRGIRSEGRGVFADEHHGRTGHVGCPNVPDL